MKAPCLSLVLALVATGTIHAQEPAPRLGQPIEEYRGRRRALMEQAQHREEGRRVVIVVRGREPAEGEDYEEGRFRQSNDFAYLTGVETPGAALLLLPAEGRAVVYLPPGRQPRGGAAALGLDGIKPRAKFVGDLFAALGAAGDRDGPTVVYLPTPDPRPSSHSADARFSRFVREGAPSARFRDVAPLIAELRKVKSPAELALLRKAIAITGDALNEVVRAVRPGLFEYQLEGKIVGTFLDAGALRPGFASIVGSGPNAAIPHYFANDRRMEEGDLVVVDIGAEYKYYTADITRTFPVSGTFSPRQRALYQLVLETQAEVARRLRPGETPLRALTGWARDHLRKSPLRARGRDGQEQTMDHFFIHGLSHYLGMDVHDVGDWSKPIQVGEVFTIEPGLYLPSENIGIRIEDDYLMTEQGVEKLSAAIPSEPDAIESRISEGRRSREKRDDAASP